MRASGQKPRLGQHRAPSSILTLGQLSDSRLLVPRLLSTSQEGVITELANRLEAIRRIENAAVFAATVVRREVAWPTFLSDGVAVPHGREEAVRRLSLAVGVSAQGIVWGGDARRVARSVFLFAITPAEAGTYLIALSALCALVQDAAALATLNTAAEPEEMLRVLNAVPLRQPAVQAAKSR